MKTFFVFLAALTLVCIAAEPKRADGLPTTTPVTQDRDHNIYNWQKRHEEILARNKEIKPDVVFFGDSIIHYWAGEPKAPKSWGADSWSNCFAGVSVENCGMGWDRTENVLWRIEHGELDGIAPKLIIITILSRGRFGGWKYEVANMDHSLMQGVEAAERIVRGSDEVTLFQPNLVNAGKR